MAFVEKYYKEESRKNFYKSAEEGKNLCQDQLQFGAILRIADAAEKMAANYSGLIADRDYYQKRMKESEKENRCLRRSIAGLRGYIKRMKK
jgi:hypothetical protein